VTVGESRVGKTSSESTEGDLAALILASSRTPSQADSRLGGHQFNKLAANKARRVSHGGLILLPIKRSCSAHAYNRGSSPVLIPGALGFKFPSHTEGLRTDSEFRDRCAYRDSESGDLGELATFGVLNNPTRSPRTSLAVFGTTSMALLVEAGAANLNFKLKLKFGPEPASFRFSVLVPGGADPSAAPA
jgi:hypothetical protein